MKKLVNYFYIIILLTITASCGVGGSDSGGSSSGGSSNPNIYLATNNVTIIANERAVVGDTATINGKIYTVVDVTQLREMIVNNEDVTQVVTSKITSMSWLIQNGPYSSAFNQDVSSWDVSNVTDMSHMFRFASAFNQDIGNWDVSNVNDMAWMLFGTSFNQDIGSWDVSNVNYMYFMFSGTSFNQDIGNWDVSNVNDMAYMFAGTAFNQDLSSWDVSSVDSWEFFDLNADAWSDTFKPNFQ